MSDYVTTEPARSAGSEFAGSGTVMLARSTRVRARRSPRLPAARGALAASVVLRGADAAARVGPHRGGIPGRPAGRLRARPRGASLQVADNETREFAEFARCDAVRAFLTRRQLFEAIERPALRALPERSIFMACLRSECRVDGVGHRLVTGIAGVQVIAAVIRDREMVWRVRLGEDAVIIHHGIEGARGPDPVIDSVAERVLAVL